MIRLLVLFLVLQTAAATKDEEGSADFPDDEDLLLVEEPLIDDKHREVNDKAQRTYEDQARDSNLTKLDKAQGADDKGGDVPIAIIIAVVVCVAATAVLIAAVFLVRRRMHNRQQGDYAVPAEQGQKPTI
ncbi:uncharacterized protein LOC136764891 isoform X2 [Amia ocellicauda]|uniref:uncharacterized protein LOC136764891 isoform X2 n=1 Tax=Amia ocellicauda TaxID=2972642 RepID=UPI0034644F9E